MARFKQVRNSSQLYTQNANGSGKSFLNEKTRLNLLDSQQSRQPYIPVGTNTDHLIIETTYNDNNTINFNVDDNYNGPNEQQLWATNIVTGLSEELLGRDQPEWIPKNERITINEQLATPSTLPDMSLIFDKNNRKNLVDKFTKKGNPVEIKFHPFNDIEYIQNNLTNQDFIKGDGEYYFLNTNLYEETSIDIELDTPVDTILQNTAYFQKASFFDNSVNNENKNINDYNFTQWSDSPYEFRRNEQTYSRLNTPTIVYNFKENCWEYRGIPAPHQFFTAQPFQIETSPVSNNDVDLSLLNSIPLNDQELDDYKKFASYFDRYILSELPLTNNPINYLRGDTQISPNDNHSNLSLPTSQFGFPHFSKFHAFDENLIDISKYINKPFIIDRVSLNLDVELQSEFYLNPLLNDIEVRNGINASLNFFLINQTANFSKGLQQKAFSNLFIKGFKNIYYLNPFKNLLGLNSSKLRDLELLLNSASYRISPSPQNSLLHTRRNVTRINVKNLNNYNNLINYATLATKLYLNDDQNNTLNNPNLLTNLENFHKKYEDFSLAFKREVITFGNINFYSKGKLDLSNPTVEDRIKNVKNRIINNNDAFIETDDYYLIPQFNNNLEIHILDYQGNVNLTTYVKKPSNLIKLNIANQNNLSSHQLNYQVDLNDSLDEYFIAAAAKKNKLAGQTISQFYNVKSETRNFLNERSGRDITNGLISELNNTNQTSLMTSSNLNIQSNQNIPKIADTALKNSGNIQITKASNASPYLLLPNDKIAFYLSISPTLSPKIFKQLLKIKKGKVRFTLHGYVPKNNKKVNDWNNLKNLNQNNLTTSIIGDDEFVTDSYNNNYYQYSNIYNIYDRVYTGKFLRNTDISAPVITINDQTASTISSQEKTIDITNLIYDDNTDNLITDQIINFECTGLNGTVTKCTLLINLNNKTILNEKDNIIIQIKNKTGLDFRVKFINKNNVTFWPLYDTNSSPSWVKENNVSSEEIYVGSTNENYTLFWDNNIFRRLTTRKIENLEIFLFGSHSLLGSKILFGEFYNTFINLKINSYKVDSKYINDFKYSYDDSFSFNNILQQTYSISNNLRLYIEGLQGELTNDEKALFLKINDDKLNRLIQEMTYFKNSTRTDNVATKNKRNHSKYFGLRSYGQFKDRVNQNTSMMMINNENVIESTVEQRFVNGQTGVDLYNFTTGVLNDLKNVTTRNKSRYCSLLDAGYNLNSEGDVQKWSTNDYWHYKHVAFKDDVTNDSYLTTIIPSVTFTPGNVRQIIF